MHILRDLLTGSGAIVRLPKCRWSNPDKYTLEWRHNDHDGVSNHQPHGCLLNRLFRRRSKKTSKLRVTGLCAGNSPGPVNSPHKGPVTRKMFPFDDVIMRLIYHTSQQALITYPWQNKARVIFMGMFQDIFFCGLLTLISEWPSNFIHYKVRGVISYPFPKFQRL